MPDSKPKIVDINTLRMAPQKILHFLIETPERYNLGADLKFKEYLIKAFAAYGVKVLDASIQEVIIAELTPESTQEQIEENLLKCPSSNSVN